MPRTTSVYLAAQEFQLERKTIDDFVTCSKAAAQTAGLGVLIVNAYYDYGIIRLHTSFENFMLRALVGVINQRPSTLGPKTGASFPAHMSKAACEYLVTGGSYFDLKGRDGLIGTLKQFLPDSHYLVQIATDPIYRPALERLWALRNFAVHRSAYSKKVALKSVGGVNMSSAGAWLSKHTRLKDIADPLTALANAVMTRAHH